MGKRVIVTEIHQTGPSDRPWSLRWRTESMPTWAFWYFETEDRAREEERQLHEQLVRTRDAR